MTVKGNGKRNVTGTQTQLVFRRCLPSGCGRAALGADGMLQLQCPHRLRHPRGFAVGAAPGHTQAEAGQFPSRHGGVDPGQPISRARDRPWGEQLAEVAGALVFGPEAAPAPGFGTRDHAEAEPAIDELADEVVAFLLDGLRTTARPA